MKILHISSERSWRGGEQQIAYLIEGSGSLGLECISFSRDGSAFEKWTSENQVKNRSARFRNSLDIATARSLKKYVEEESPDLIHIHSGKGHDIYALATLIGLRTVAVLSRRVDFPVKSNPWAQWKYNHEQIKRIICVSDAIREMTKISLKKPEKAVTVHSGIDLSRFDNVAPDTRILRDEFGIPEDRILIGNVAALAPHKDYGTFLRTARKALDRGLQATFLIIGEGPERPQIEKLVKDLNLSNDVVLCGFREDIPKILPELDIFFISSETEGLGTSVLDAFAARVPVVATAAGGIPESVRDNETGLLHPVADDGALSDALIELAGNPELAARLVEAASKHLQSFSKSATALKTIEIYREVLDF